MIDWHAWGGILGTVLIVGSYLMLQLGRLKVDDLHYSLANALGAILLIVSLVYEFNLGAMIIECFWLAISLVGIVKSIQSRRRYE
ncbi:MAG: hypothetical protein P8J27_17645 [Mariniblastus sp.]|nr:hypothetical protein [Mariniblastus sp.]